MFFKKIFKIVNYNCEDKWSFKENLNNLVHIFQKKWADIVFKIGKAYKQKINLDNLIFELLNNVYAFNQGEVTICFHQSQSI